MTTPAAAADISVTANTTARGPAYVGDESTYTLVIRNNGPEPANRVRVTLSARNFEMTRPRGACEALPCYITELGPGSAASIFVDTRIPQEGPFGFTLTAFALQPDPDPANNSYTLDVGTSPREAATDPAAGAATETTAGTGEAAGSVEGDPLTATTPGAVGGDPGGASSTGPAAGAGSIKGPEGDAGDGTTIPPANGGRAAWWPWPWMLAPVPVLAAAAWSYDRRRRLRWRRMVSAHVTLGPVAAQAPDPITFAAPSVGLRVSLLPGEARPVGAVPVKKVA